MIQPKNKMMDSEEFNTSDGEVSQEKREKIKQKLSSMTFEDLQKLKAKIGAKEYEATVFGDRKTQHTRSDTTFKRANKNRPREMSSKKRPGKKEKTVQVTKQQTFRDPRFDPLCGTYDEKAFKNNYKFVHKVRKEERLQIAEEYANTQDEKRKSKLKYLMQRMDNQIREQENRMKLKLKEREERKEIRDKLKQGQKPVFKRKSEKKVEKLISKYEELKKSNKLQKHIEKRSKKLAHKDRKANNFEI